MGTNAQDAGPTGGVQQRSTSRTVTIAKLVPKLTDDWFSSGYVPPPQRPEPVTLGEPLWKLMKGDSHRGGARAIAGIGLELRFEWNGDLRASQAFKGWDELEQMASVKRAELEARGCTG